MAKDAVREGHESVVPAVLQHIDNPGERLPSLTFPYSWRQGDRALIKAVKDAEGETTMMVLYPYPIYISAIRKGEIGGGSFTTLKHFAPHDGWQDAVIPSGDLTADGAFRALGNNHISVEPHVQKLFTAWLAKQIGEYRAHHKAELHHETFGWKDDDSFLIGDTLYRGPQELTAGISDELKRYVPKLKATGDLTAWSAAAQTLFRPGYEYQAMAVLASFGAALMRYAPYPGMIYSIVHESTGQGKTFALEAGGSVWGQPKALEMSHRDEKVSTGDTIKSQFRQLALMKSLPILVDELRDTEAEKLRSFVLNFTDGNPSKGLTKDGRMRDQFGAWATVLIATSNKSLIDTITSNNDPAAASRIFEVNATLPADVSAAAGDKIRAAFRKNSGVAGVAFVKSLMSRLDWLPGAVDNVVENYTNLLQAKHAVKSGGDRYFASFLACCTVAGAVLDAEGILKIDLAHMKDWALERWDQERRQIDGAQKTPVEAMGAFLRDSISRMLIVDKAAVGRSDVMVIKHPQREPLAARFERDGGMMYVDRRTVQRWCLAENQHFGALGSALLKAGVVTDRDGKRNLGAGTEYKGMGQTTVWTVDTKHPLMSGEVREIADPAGTEVRALETMNRKR